MIKKLIEEKKIKEQKKKLKTMRNSVQCCQLRKLGMRKWKRNGFGDTKSVVIHCQSEFKIVQLVLYIGDIGGDVCYLRKDTVI